MTTGRMAWGADPGGWRCSGGGRHASAHVVHSRFDARFELAALAVRPWIGLLEDAWVERRAISAFPGLYSLWRQLVAVPATVDRVGEPDLAAVLDRCALALLDSEYRDDHSLVAASREAFARLPQDDSDRYTGILESAERLAALAKASGLEFTPSADTSTIVYRDDNRYLWTAPRIADLGDPLAGGRPQVRKYVNLMEMLNTLDVEMQATMPRRCGSFPPSCTTTMARPSMSARARRRSRNR